MPPPDLRDASGTHYPHWALEGSRNSVWKESWKLKQRESLQSPASEALSPMPAPPPAASGPSEAGQLMPERNTQTARKECQQILHFPKTECFPDMEQRDANQKTLWA